jgi:hypothetical protein
MAKDTNTGNRNTGYSNTGNRNTGDWNTGNRNTGYSNTGYSNTGDWNTGNRNTGYRNTGNSNTGDWNTGYSNTGNSNAGMFNTNEPFARFFNRETNIKMSDFFSSGKNPDYSDFDLTVWIEEDIMTKEEKEENPTYKTTGGYLKSFEYKEAWGIFWRKTTEENKKKFLELPNFDWAIFTEITGIEPESKEPSLSGSEVEVKLNGKVYKAIIQ